MLEAELSCAMFFFEDIKYLVDVALDVDRRLIIEEEGQVQEETADFRGELLVFDPGKPCFQFFHQHLLLSPVFFREYNSFYDNLQVNKVFDIALNSY